VAKKGAKQQEAVGVVTVEGERERAIALLSEHFAQDNLSLDDFEKRVEMVYKASSVPALRDLTRDLTPAAPAAAAVAQKDSADPRPVQVEALERESIRSIMSSAKRGGVWRPARHVDLLTVMSESELDLTQAVLQPGVTEIRLRGLMAQVKVIIPPGVRVVLQPSSIMSSVSDETLDPPAVGSGAPVVRITGTVVMTELRAVVRRREGSGDADE
jgi:hypothetical protein